MRIPLTKGKFATVDTEDFDNLSKYNWFYLDGYAARRGRASKGEKKTVRMHRILLGAKECQKVDHINQDKLDNRKSNLRICTHGQNRMNMRKLKNNTSGYKGVFWRGDRNVWIARIRFEGKLIYAGSSRNKVIVAGYYNKMAKKLFGEFAYLNEIPCIPQT